MGHIKEAVLHTFVVAHYHLFTVSGKTSFFLVFIFTLSLNPHKLKINSKNRGQFRCNRFKTNVAHSHQHVVWEGVIITHIFFQCHHSFYWTLFMIIAYIPIGWIWCGGRYASHEPSFLSSSKCSWDQKCNMPMLICVVVWCNCEQPSLTMNLVCPYLQYIVEVVHWELEMLLFSPHDMKVNGDPRLLKCVSATLVA